MKKLIIVKKDLIDRFLKEKIELKEDKLMYKGIPAIITPMPNSFLPLNRCGRGSKLMDLPIMQDHICKAASTFFELQATSSTVYNEQNYCISLPSLNSNNFYDSNSFKEREVNTNCLSINYNYLFNSINQSNNIHCNYFINDVENTSNNKTCITPIKYGVSEEYSPINWEVNRTNSPLFQSEKYIIKVPSKVEYTLKRYVSKRQLKEIHPNIDVAIELCMLFISQLTSTYYSWEDGSNPDGWKPLKAAYLRALLSYKHDTYKRIRELLENPTNAGAVIECDYENEKGQKCYYYRICSNYMGKGIKEYILKTDLVKRLKIKYHQKRLKDCEENIICKNLIQLYYKIIIPTVDEIKLNAKQLIKSGYKSKKGKLLTMQNKHSKDYFSNASDRIFVEDGIEVFNYLTRGGFLLPTPSSEHAGYRITDSFTLMPSFIRGMIKIDGKPIVEVDFSCLHPNIAMTLYGGDHSYLTHKGIAEKLAIPDIQVKIEHLSFFNKHLEQMKDSPLYSYYKETEPQMLNNLIKEKYETERKYKITSQKMFEKEVAIMTDVIKKLSKEGILVGYVYDALFCCKGHAERVRDVMNETVLEHKVFTVAKINGDDIAPQA